MVRVMTNVFLLLLTFAALSFFNAPLFVGACNAPCSRPKPRGSRLYSELAGRADKRCDCSETRTRLLRRLEIDHGTEILNLSYNYISELSDEAFESLPDLKNLDLQTNRISQIERDTFSHLSSLKRLNLSDNGLSTLPLGVFDHLEDLKTLDLRRNRLNPHRLVCSLAPLFRRGVKIFPRALKTGVYTDKLRCGIRPRLCYEFPGHNQRLFCKCRRGEVFNGERCERNKRCSRSGAADCRRRPVCRQSNLNYICSCPQGWTPSQYRCVQTLAHPMVPSTVQPVEPPAASSTCIYICIGVCVFLFIVAVAAALWRCSAPEKLYAKRLVAKRVCEPQVRYNTTLSLSRPVPEVPKYASCTNVADGYTCTSEFHADESNNENDVIAPFQRPRMLEPQGSPQPRVSSKESDYLTPLPNKDIYFSENSKSSEHCTESSSAQEVPAELDQ